MPPSYPPQIDWGALLQLAPDLAARESGRVDVDVVVTGIRLDPLQCFHLGRNREEEAVVVGPRGGACSPAVEGDKGGLRV